MPEIKCFACKKSVYKSPSKVSKRNFCSLYCRIEISKIELPKFGSKTRINEQWIAKHQKKAVIAARNRQGEKHWAWKGNRVGYRGLHYWLRRKLGVPRTCSVCKFTSQEPRKIHWANISGNYLRETSDYTSLCRPCHDAHDSNLRKKIGRNLYQP